MKHLYIVVWRMSPTSTWKPLADGVFECRSNAELVVKAEQVKGSTMEYAIVEGPIISPETDIKRSDRELGPFV